MPLIIDTLKRKSNVLYETILKSLQLIYFLMSILYTYYIYRLSTYNIFVVVLFILTNEYFKLNILIYELKYYIIYV